MDRLSFVVRHSSKPALSHHPVYLVHFPPAVACAWRELSNIFSKARLADPFRMPALADCAGFGSCASPWSRTLNGGTWPSWTTGEPSSSPTPGFGGCAFRELRQGGGSAVSQRRARRVDRERHSEGTPCVRIRTERQVQILEVWQGLPKVKHNDSGLEHELFNVLVEEKDSIVEAVPINALDVQRKHL